MEVRRENDYIPISQKNRINWAAIIGGTIIAIFFQMLLGLFGLAVGITALKPGAGIGAGFSIGSGIYLVLTTIISVFIGAFAAGRFAGYISRYDGMLHGITTLALLTLLMVFTITTGVGSLMGGALSYGLQIAKLPQVQQVLPSGTQMKGETTGAAANITPQQQIQLQKQADKYATAASWTAFITALLSLVAAAIGGILGMRYRTARERHISA